MTKEIDATDLTEKKRDYAQDIAKGIGILLVMQVHICDYPSWYRAILAVTSVWLMAFFFTLSGYYYRPGARKPSESIRRRVKQLIKPYFIYSIVIWACSTIYNLVTSACSFLECVKQYFTFLVSRNMLVLLGLADKKPAMDAGFTGINFTSIAVPFWFVLMLFMADIVFFLIADWVLSSTKRFISVTSGFIILSFGLNVLVDSIGFGLPWNFQNVPMAIALMLIGAMLGKYKVLSKDYASTKWKVINSIVVLGVIALIQWKFQGAGSFAGGSFTYFGAVEVFPCVLLGTIAPFMAVSFARLVEKIPVINKALVWVGLRTLPILLVHIPISKFVFKLTGLPGKSFANAGAAAAETAAVYAITLAVIVAYRIVWELILKAIHSKKKKAQEA